MGYSRLEELERAQGENIRSILRPFFENGRFLLSADRPFAERVAERVYGRSAKARSKITRLDSKRWRNLKEKTT